MSLRVHFSEHCTIGPVERSRHAAEEFASTHKQRRTVQKSPLREPADRAAKVTANKRLKVGCAFCVLLWRPSLGNSQVEKRSSPRFQHDETVPMDEKSAKETPVCCLLEIS